MPGSSLKLPLKHLNGHKTLGNPCIAGKLTVLKGPFIIYGGGWHRREMFFVAKILLTQPLKKSKI